MSITITGLEKVMRNLSPAQLEAPKRRFLGRVALIVERNAKRRAPVRTGHLRRSITHRVERDRAIVGTNVKYAPFQELGTRYIRPRAFLSGGLQDSQGAIRSEITRFSSELASKLGGA
jgi:HK97 gp10 family phage protein